MVSLSSVLKQGLVAIIIAPFLTQCASPPKDVGQNAKLATPGGHNMSEREYPFDDQGNYRKDWVKNGSTRKRPKKSDATIATPPSLATAPRPTQPPPQPVYQPAPAPRPTPPPAPRPQPAPAPAKYHKVISGDTLYALSRRYGVSITSLKQTNGLTSDTIRLGQTLRIP